MDNDIENSIINEVQTEFVTHLKDPKYHLNDKNIFILPSTITPTDLNDMLSNLLSIEKTRFSFYCYGLQLIGTIADLLDQIDFKSEYTLTITYALFDDSRPKAIVNLNSFISSLDYLNNLNLLVISTADGLISTVHQSSGERKLERRITDGEIAAFDTKVYKSDTFISSISSYGHVEVAQITDSTYTSISYFKGHSNSGSAIKFSPDFNLIASSGYDRAIRLFSIVNLFDYCNLETKKRDSSTFYNILDNSAIFWGHSDAVVDIAYTANELINSVSLDNTYRLWDVTTCKCKSTVNLSKTPNCIDNNLVEITAIGHINGKISIYDNKSDTSIFDSKLHTRIVSDIKWSKSNDQIFASVSNDGSFVISDLRFPKSPIFTWKSDISDEFIRACCWIDNNNLAIGSSKGEVSKHTVGNLSI